MTETSIVIGNVSPPRERIAELEADNQSLRAKVSLALKALRSIANETPPRISVESELVRIDRIACDAITELTDG